MTMNGVDDHAPGHPGSTWCRYCSKPDGSLQEFQERFERMVSWSVRKDGLDRGAAEEATRSYLRSMPVWRDHPSLN